MRSIREDIGGFGNILFKNSYLWAQMREGVIPDVYVQSEKYFAKYRDEIRILYGSRIGLINKVALHIRRGDYLKATQFHTNLWETEYYKEAVKLFPNERFLVFCRDNQGDAQDEDDKEWCLKNLPSLGIKFDFWEHKFSETEDLNAMASCKAIIGANSSFSWWAAYLGNPNKAVIMPAEESWFTDNVKRTELLPEWTKITV